MTSHEAALEKYRARYAQLKQELQSLGFVCVGSLQTRYLECGKAGCHCHQDQANRHGPYHYWTRKVHGRTIAVLIGDDDVIVYRERIANNRTLEDTVREMRKVAAKVLKLEEKRRPR